ncbi:MAG: UDP-4-amino-4,6-dideoxy-N-acetyl-beta-L-altrosamine transaminase [Roseibacillus sp.]|nr:UDP-4-amino-4,6-dideoxy-N-acetyl-beta-L-altrosamine transaminase [Roseibacillus sp.]
MLPYGRQTIDEDDIAAVVRILRSDFLTCGPEVAAFEQEFAELVGAKHAVAVCNATAALHLAMVVAEIGPGDRVVTTPNTFVASANCAAFVGATPDFSDIREDDYNLDPDALEGGWRDDTKAVVAVAYAGQSADMPRIASVARERGAVVIEDACHGTGGGFCHEGTSWKLGGHPWADMTTFSFHPVKTMTTGEGGILVTDNDTFAERARQLRAHGIVRNRDAFRGFGDPGNDTLTEQGPWVYEMQELGYNYRITDLQCALGRTQLAKLPSFVERRREIVSLYNAAFQGIPWLRTPRLRNQSDHSEISWHLYTLLIDFAKLGTTRTEAMAALREAGVGSQVLYIPVHLHPYYRETYGYAPGKCPVAEGVYEQALSIPLYPKLKQADLQHVISTVKSLG